jgi:serine/threonine-protein kinase
LLHSSMPADPFSGTRYQTVSKLSESRRGEVYAVRHVELGKAFAAKLLLDQSMQDPRMIDRFRLEAQSLGRLRHPNIVDISGFGHTSSGVPFMLMELLKGRSLEEELRLNGAVPPALACDWLDQLLSALEAVHELGIVHRDIAPRHVFLHQASDGTRQPKLTGFGSVRVQAGMSLAPSPLRIPTDMGEVVGDPRFSSPEAVRGEPVDARGDLYQAGQLLTLMVLGKADRLTEEASIWKPRLADIAPELERLLSRALSPEVDERFASAAEFRQQLREVQPVLPRAVLENSALRDVPLARGRTSWPRWAVFVLLAAIMAIAIVSLGITLRGGP